MFELDDLEKEWTWTRPFDYIVSRSNAGCFSDPQDFIRQAYEYGPFQPSGRSYPLSNRLPAGILSPVATSSSRTSSCHTHPTMGP